MFQLDFKVQHPTVPTRNCRLNSQITRSTRSEITAAMTFEVWKHTQYPTADDYNAICKLLAEKHSALGYKSIEAKKSQDHSTKRTEGLLHKMRYLYQMIKKNSC